MMRFLAFLFVSTIGVVVGAGYAIWRFLIRRFFVTPEVRELERKRRELKTQLKTSKDVAELGRELEDLESQISDQRVDELEKLREDFERLSRFPRRKQQEEAPPAAKTEDVESEPGENPSAEKTIGPS